jgi:sarcosine oxidase
MGSAAAWALAARGADVTVYEQFDLDHARGSSHGRSRIVRSLYPDPYWVQQAQEAMAGWRELERQSGVQLLELRGIVELVPDLSLASAQALAACEVEHRMLDVDEARAYGAVLPPGWSALFQPDAGIIRADLARHAFLDVSGVRVETGRRVESLDDVDADVVVVTAGPWVRTLVPDLPVRVTRETLAYFRGPPMPAVVDLHPETGGHAMYALRDPVHGVKAGVHHAGIDADPDEPGEPVAELVERVAAWVAERLPDVDPEPVAAETCLYTSTADESFIVERRGRVVIGSACSGHGFKFAPIVGRRLAALALE